MRVGISEVVHLRTGMAAKASDTDVGSDERESHPGVFGELSFGNPRAFVVALCAASAQLSLVWVCVATTATTCRKDLGWSAVVVAPETLSRLVRPIERHARLRSMIKGEIASECVPVVTDVTEGTVSGEQSAGKLSWGIVGPCLGSQDCGCRFRERPGGPMMQDAVIAHSATAAKR